MPPPPQPVPVTVRPRPNLLVVVRRELVRSGRRWQTWALRLGVVGALLLLLVALWSEQVPAMEQVDRVALGATGRSLFAAFVGLQTALIVLLTPILVANAVIEERDGGTLELLALTGLSPGAILRGKVLSRVLSLELVVLGGLPVLALCSSLGGFGPLDLLNILVQDTTMILSLAAVTSFLALYGRGPFRPAIQAWFWTMGAWWLGSLPHAILQMDGRAFATISPSVALFSARGWQILGPPLAQLPVSAAVVWFAVAGLKAMLAGADDPAGGFGSLSRDFDDLRRVKRSLLWAGVLGVGMVPLLVFQRPLGRVFAPLGQLSLPWASLWIWVGTGLYLLGIRELTLRREAKGRRTPLKGWSRLSKDWDQAGGWRSVAEARGGDEGAPAPPSSPVSARRARREVRVARSRRPVFGRSVWSDPVLWRETMTAAWGGLGRSLFRLYLAFGGVIVLFFLVGGFRRAELAVVASVCAVSFAALAALMTASASVASEVGAGTLPLLLTTRLSPARVLRSKALSSAAFWGPAWVAAVAFGLQGVSAFGGDVTEVERGLMFGRWLGLSSWSLAVLGATTVVCQGIGLRARTTTRAWIGTVLWAGWSVAGSTVARALVGRHPLGERLVGLWNPLLYDGTWQLRRAPWVLGGSAVLWALLAAGVFWANVRRLRRG